MAESIASFLQQYNLSAELISFIVSIFPIVELRGGIIVARLLGLPVLKAYLICLMGNMLPIPFILLFIKKIFSLLKKFKWSAKLVNRLEESALKKSDSVRTKLYVGLFLFVAIPLPGTGGWTGALIASLLDMPIKKSFISIFAGVMTAGLIMIILSYFVPGLFGF